MAHLSNLPANLRASTEIATNYQHSPMILERRRNLFPSKDAQIDQELGQIQPICYDTTSSSETSEHEDNNIEDYELIGVVDKQGFSTPISKEKNLFIETMSPLHLSPFTNIKTSKKFSPSQNLKTPHDTCSKSNLPKLQRELLEESKSGKGMDSSLTSPVHSNSPDLRSGKVRTALFLSSNENEADISLSTKSFYSKSCSEDISDILSTSRDRSFPKFTKVVAPRVGCRYNKKRKFGQINNGVSHKIRKPKQKKLNKVSQEKATKTMLKSNEAINEYIKDISEMRKIENSGKKLIQNTPKVVKCDPKLDSTLKNYLRDLEELNHFGNGYNKLIKHSGKETKPDLQEDKENVPLESRKRHLSPEKCEKETHRKFFKSNRGKPVIRIENICDFDKSSDQNHENIQKKNDFGENGTTNIILTSQNTNYNTDKYANKQSETHNNLSESQKQTTFDTIDLDIDENEEIISNMNIDSILSALNGQSPEKNSSEILLQNDQQYFGLNTNSELFMTAVNLVNEGFDNTSHIIQNFVSSNQTNQVGNQQFDNVGQTSQNFDNLKYLTQVVPTYLTEHCQNNLLTVPQTSFYDSGSPMAEMLNTSFESTLQGTDTPPNQVTLEAYTSISASENSIQLHNNILSPISQMCNVTSGLALTDSPKKGKNLISVLNNMPNARNTNNFDSVDKPLNYSVDMERQKYFPIFCGPVKPVNSGEQRERNEVRKTTAKRFKGLAEDQMLLDAGQKKFGYTLCTECNIVYHAGDPGDEIQHQNYHNSSHILRFMGWKNEHLVADFQKNGRIIKVLPSDSKIWIKKVKDLMQVVNRDLGCYEMSYDISDSEVYLYVRNRTIVGCVVATVPKSGGHKMLSTFEGVPMCTELSYPIKCGISHIWVAPYVRKQGIASALMDAVKTSFILGSILTSNDIALTSPTESGMAFAAKYFKTNDYLIYFGK